MEQNEAAEPSWSLLLHISCTDSFQILVCYSNFFCDLQKELSTLFYLDILFNHQVGLQVMQW